MSHPMTSFERLRGAQIVRFGRGETWSGTQCQHVAEIKDVEPGTPNGCEDCLRLGTEWVHLRLCLTCGKVACCNDSPQRHSLRHFLDSNHPMIQSWEPDEDWMWCYPDELFYEPAAE
jgi:uncharacterized UBP type Zn finger protein